MKHLKTTSFATNEELVGEVFRSPFFENLEINSTFEIRERKRQVNIMRPYRCGITVYQLAKFCMLEFYYDLVDNYLNRRDFELIQMDTGSLSLALSGDSINELVKPELREEYNNSIIAELISTSKYHDRTPGLFKVEFHDNRMIALTSKCYNAEDNKSCPKISCKGIRKSKTK